MNMFSSQEFAIFIGIIFVLMLILVVIPALRQRSSKGDNLEKAEQKPSDKSGSATPAVFSPELEMGTDEPPRYQKRQYFFTFQERKFYEALRAAVGGRYQIFAKVRMADVMWLSNEPMNRKYFNNQIRCKHLDFVLCEPSKQMPQLAIELDDSSHQRYERRAGDEFKDMACRTAGFPLKRIKIQEKYSAREILDLIQSV